MGEVEEHRGGGHRDAVKEHEGADAEAFVRGPQRGCGRLLHQRRTVARAAALAARGLPACDGEELVARVEPAHAGRSPDGFDLGIVGVRVGGGPLGHVRNGEAQAEDWDDRRAHRVLS